MNADRAVWKVTFSDGAWVKMIADAAVEIAFEQARREFGEGFSGIESLPDTDAAVIRAKGEGKATLSRPDMKPMPISKSAQYRDKVGNLWRVFEKYPFGKALMVRVDRPGVSMEMRYCDIRANMVIA
jgi:hypothetical protein